MIYVVVWSMQLVVGTLVSPVLAHLIPMAGFGALSAAIALFQLLIVLTVLGLDQALEMQRLEDADGNRARGLLASARCWLLSSRPRRRDIGLVGAGARLRRRLAAATGYAVVDCARNDRAAGLVPPPGRGPAGQVRDGEHLVHRREPAVRDPAPVRGPPGRCDLCMGRRDRPVGGHGPGLVWARPRWRGVADLATLRRAVRLGLPLVLAGLSQFVIIAGDRFIIQRTYGEVQVARYQVAFTVGNVMVLLLPSPTAPGCRGSRQ